MRVWVPSVEKTVKYEDSLVIKLEGRRQGSNFKRMTKPEDMIQTDKNQISPRWQIIFH